MNMSVSNVRTGRTRNQPRVQGRFASNPGAISSYSVNHRVSATSIRTQMDREHAVIEIIDVFCMRGEKPDFIPLNVGEGPLSDLVRIVLKPAHSVGKRCLFSLAKTRYLTERSLKALPRRTVKRGSIIKRHIPLMARRRLPDFSKPDEQMAVRRLLLKLRRLGRLNGESVDEVLISVHGVLKTYDHRLHRYSNFPLGQSFPNTSNTAHDNSAPHAPPIPVPMLDDDVYRDRVLATALSIADYSALKMVLAETISCSSMAKVWLARVNRDAGSTVPLTHLERSLVDFCVEDNPEKKESLRVGLEGLLKALIELRRSRRLPLLEDEGFWPEGVPRSTNQREQ